jgi:hypothetical protein
MRPAQVKSYKGPFGAPPDFSEAFLSLAQVTGDGPA